MTPDKLTLSFYPQTPAPTKDEKTSVKVQPPHGGRARNASRSDSLMSLQPPSQPGGQSSTTSTSLRPPPERQMSKVAVQNATPRRTGVSIFGIVAAARAWKRMGLKKQAAVPEKPKVKLENTYRLGPEPEQIFRPDQVRVVIKDILTSSLDNFKYTSEGSKQMCCTLASEIKARVKRMGFPRYKIVCNVIILQNKGQGSEIASRSVWNANTDSYASYTFTTNAVVAIGNVHGVYFE